MGKRILLLNQTFYPDCAATSQYLTDLAVELKKVGYGVTVISDRRSYDDRRKVLPKREVYKGVRIYRVGSTALGKKTKFHRGIDYLTFNISFFLRLLTLPKYDFAIGLTTPPWISFFGVVFSLFKKTSFIHWAMDVNPDQAVKLGWVKENSLFFKLLNIWARFTYKKSQKIIALDKYMAQLIESKGVMNHKVHIIPIWSHDEITSVSHAVNPFRKRYSLENKFVVMYSGNFSICHPLDTLLEAARRLNHHSNIIFMFIGGGVRLNEILAFREKHKLDNVFHLPYQKREELKYSLSAADLHVVSMGNEFVGMVHPSKIYGILAAGRQFVLIGPEKSHIGDIINEYGIGYQVNHGDVDRLLQVIAEVKTHSPQQKVQIETKSTYLAQNIYSRERRIAEIINNCIKPLAAPTLPLHLRGGIDTSEV